MGKRFAKNDNKLKGGQQSPTAGAKVFYMLALCYHGPLPLPRSPAQVCSPDNVSYSHSSCLGIPSSPGGSMHYSEVLEECHNIGIDGTACRSSCSRFDVLNAARFLEEAFIAYDPYAAEQRPLCVGSKCFFCERLVRPSSVAHSPTRRTPCAHN